MTGTSIIQDETEEVVDAVMRELDVVRALCGTQIDDLDAADATAITGPVTQIGYGKRMEGGYVVHRGGFYYLFYSDGSCCDGEFSGYQVKVADTIGAGDTFTGTLAAALARRTPWHEALNEANAAAALSTQAPGAVTAMPTRSQMLDFLAAGTRTG